MRPFGYGISHLTTCGCHGSPGAAITLKGGTRKLKCPFSGWHSPSLVLLPARCVLVKLRDEKANFSRARPDFGPARRDRHLCHCPAERARRENRSHAERELSQRRCRSPDEREPAVDGFSSRLHYAG